MTRNYDRRGSLTKEKKKEGYLELFKPRVSGFIYQEITQGHLQSGTEATP